MNRTFSRPIFWPLVLIALGVLWLLSNFGVIASANMWGLLQFWPVLLIAVGLDLIFRQRWPWAGNLIALITVTLAVLAVVFAPRLGLAAPGAGLFGWRSFTVGGIRGSGQVVTEARPVSDFDTVSFNAFGEMTITQGDSESLTIEAEDNVLPLIRTEVRGGTLFIEPRDNDFGVNLTRPLRYTLVVKTLAGLDLSGAGNVVVQDLKTDQLQVTLSGAGSLTFDGLEASTVSYRLSGAGSVSASGEVTDLEARLSGFGSYEGEDLRAESVDVTISGAGSATVWATKNLDARISGLGSVQYYGQPQVTKNVSGLGSVQHLGDK